MSILLRRRMMMQHNNIKLDTSPRIAEYDKSLTSSGGVVVTIGGCYTEFYDLLSETQTIMLYFSDTENIAFSSDGKLQFWSETMQTEYWSAAATRNKEKNYPVASGSTKIRTSLATANIDDSYMYCKETGYIYFAGKNTIYYGMKNING